MIGIYALWFEESSMLYIGQSQDIDRRFKEHKSMLRNGKHTNYLVQNEFEKYGMPELVILERCKIHELNDLEIQWTREFDSINTGLNIIEAGQVGYGVYSNSSKYHKITILKVFSMLSKTSLSLAKIASKARCNISLVSDIKRSSSHLWLREEYPTLYNKMKTRVNAKRLGGELVIFIDPDGKEHYVSNIRDFVSTIFNDRNSDSYINLRRGLSSLRAKKRNSYRGWKLRSIS